MYFDGIYEGSNETFILQKGKIKNRDGRGVIEFIRLFFFILFVALLCKVFDLSFCFLAAGPMLTANPIHSNTSSG